MKKTNKLAIAASATFLGGIAFVAILSVASQHTRRYQPNTTKNVSDDDQDRGFRGEFDYFNNRRKNTKTGVVDPNDVIKAQLAVENFSKNNMRKASSTNSTQSSIVLNWKENGPDNVGGRTRAILVDKYNHNHIFAGSVSGGLWISNNAGSTWSKYNDQLQNLCVTCITQSANGDIYFGTGEGVTYQALGIGSGGFTGGGIWKSVDDGNTFNRLAATIPPANQAYTPWTTEFQKLASDPVDSNRIYAASARGLYISQNAGATWTIENTTRTSASDDVEVASDGSVFAAIGAACFTSSTGLPGSFTKVGTSLPGGNMISLAIAPQDPNYLYASLANGSGGLIGIYQSVDKGATWNDIGPGGSILFNPFASGGGETLSGQGTYDNIIAVYPNNKYKVIVGGTTLYSWTQTNTSTPGAGQWTSISNYFGFPGYAYYVHPDQHAITFDLTNPNTVYFGNDGGVYKSLDGGVTFNAYNRGYDVTQNYSVAFQPTQVNNYGMMGGAQDNGTNYISGNSTPIMDAAEINGGDGVDAEISQLNGNAFFAGSPNSPIVRSSNQGASFAQFYSIRLAALTQNIFVVPTALYESANDPLSHDSTMFIADKNYAVGDTVHTVSPRNNSTPFSFVTNTPFLKDSTYQIQDLVQSKLVVGYDGASGVWMTVRPIDFSTTPYWYQITPNVNGEVTTMAFSPDGDHLFVGTSGGQLSRVDNLSQILHSDGFPVHGVPFIDSVTGDVSSAQHVETTKTIINGGGQYITRIAVDPNNGNNVVITLGNYGNNTYVMYSNNALSASPTFTSAQGNLPKMPLYSDLITKDNPKEVIIGSEYGVWVTADITQGAGTVWTQANNNEMPNCPVLMIRQQTLPYWWSNINNSGMIYVGTHGRGMWSCDNYFHAFTTGVPEQSISKTSVVIYPNPMINNGTVAFSTDKSENVVLNFYDLQGKLMKTMNDNTMPGENKIPFTTDGLSAGTYLLSITGSTAHSVSRFV
ncbi:MAG: T9SS type A sorting domain-containing protein, partial [Bacteroidia bacterium]